MLTHVFTNILQEKSSPLGDQTYDYDASVSTFSITTNGFKDFFDVESDIENRVTCELKASDCSSTLVGTEADGTTPLSVQDISMSPINPY